MPQLPVTGVAGERDIGLAWLSARDLPALADRFRAHVLATAG